MFICAECCNLYLDSTTDNQCFSESDRNDNKACSEVFYYDN